MRIFSGLNFNINYSENRPFFTNSFAVSPLKHDVVCFMGAMPKGHEKNLAEESYNSLFFDYLENKTDYNTVAKADKNRKQTLLSLLYELKYDKNVSNWFKRKIVTADDTNSLIVKLIQSSNECKKPYFENIDLKLINALFEVVAFEPEFQEELLLIPVKDGNKNGIPIIYAGHKEVELLLKLSPNRQVFERQASQYSRLSNENRRFIDSLRRIGYPKPNIASIDIFKNVNNLNQALRLVDLPSKKLEILKQVNDKGKTPLICYPETCIAVLEELMLKIPSTSKTRKLLDKEISKILTTQDSKGKIPIAYMNLENSLKLLKLSPDEQTLAKQIDAFNFGAEYLNVSQVEKIFSVAIKKTEKNANKIVDTLASKWLKAFDSIDSSAIEIRNFKHLTQLLKKTEDEKERKKIIKAYCGNDVQKNPCVTSDFNTLSCLLGTIKDPIKRESILNKYLHESRYLLCGKYLGEAIQCIQQNCVNTKDALREFLFESKIAKTKATIHGLFRAYKETIYVKYPFISSLEFEDLVIVFKAIKDINLKKEILFSNLHTRYNSSPEFEQEDEFEPKVITFSKHFIEKFKKNTISNKAASIEFEKILFEILDSHLITKAERIKLIQTYLPLIPAEKQNYYKNSLIQLKK